MEFESNPSSQGMEATFVCGIGGQECRGSDRRPMSRKKPRKIRYTTQTYTLLSLDQHDHEGRQSSQNVNSFDSVH